VVVLCNPARQFENVGVEATVLVEDFANRLQTLNFRAFWKADANARRLPPAERDGNPMAQLDLPGELLRDLIVEEPEKRDVDGDFGDRRYPDGLVLRFRK
jgi:hypothetical protein